MTSLNVRAFVAALALSIAGPASANPPISINGPTSTPIGTIQPNSPSPTNIANTLQPGLTTWSDHRFDGVKFRLPSSWQTSTGNNRLTAGSASGDWYIKFMSSTKNYSTPAQPVEEMITLFRADNFKPGGSANGFDYDLSAHHHHKAASGTINGKPMYIHFIAFQNGSKYTLVRFSYKEELHTTMKAYLEGILTSIDAP